MNYEGKKANNEQNYYHVLDFVAFMLSLTLFIEYFKQ